MRKHNNFRELGGIRTEDGRTVKHGCFYRSGALGYMDDDELTEVASCNIRHIMDFRSSFEKDRLPDPSLPGAEYHHMNAMSLPDGTEVDLSPKGIGAGMFTKENGDRFMEHFYGTLPFSPAYREMFDFIKRDEVPVLFHCTAGKDRTGIGAVLILLVLGCSEETAIEDYLKTNDFRAESIERLLGQYSEYIDKDPELKEAMTAIAGVSRSSAEYSLQKILEKYETYEDYFREVLGLGSEEIRELRRKYTESEDEAESVSE